MTAAPTAPAVSAAWQDLDDFDPAVRRRALEAVRATSAWPGTRRAVNVHCHTFFSFNAYGFSPTHVAASARALGLEVAGTVDFDCLDSADEFVIAAAVLGLKGVVSIESRVFVPELAGVAVNSPGEPGIAYHMGVGFPHAVEHPLFDRMWRAADGRLRAMVARVNPTMRPVELDYERDVVSWVPGDTATERHVCEALERKARAVFPHPAERAAFWSDRIGAAPEGVELQSLARARLLKRGGVGYERPDGGSFPRLDAMNRAVLECGAIPALTWLDGTSEGERDPDRLLDLHRSHGAAAIAVIPDRNFTPGVRDDRLANLYAVVDAAERHGFPVLVGTEMNAPGNKLVDDFEGDELHPLVPVFLKGARIVYAHTILQRRRGLGYLGPWARKSFGSVAERNEFYAQVGRVASPSAEPRLEGLGAEPRPDDVLSVLA